MAVSLLLLGLLLAAQAAAEDIVDAFPDAAQRGKIAIIIDDVGYQLKPGQQLAKSPHALTIAIIPFTPHGGTIAELAHHNRKEVMLHAPMEPLEKHRWETGLNASMNEKEVRQSLDKMLVNVPHAVGVNNHGGSKFTQDQQRMRWLMSSLAEKNLFFIDSKTIASSMGTKIATEVDLPHASRDIFLDNQKDPQLIRKQLNKLRRLAGQSGQAIAIGHPHAETMDVIVEELPNFYRNGIVLVSASKLLSNDTTDSGRQKKSKSDNIAALFVIKNK